MAVFTTCREHIDCVVKESDAGIEHIPSDARPGVAPPPAILTTLTAAEADRLWDAMRACQDEVTALADRIEVARSERLAEVRRDVTRYVEQAKSDIAELRASVQRVFAQGDGLAKRVEDAKGRQLEQVRTEVSTLREDTDKLYKVALSAVVALRQEHTARFGELADRLGGYATPADLEALGATLGGRIRVLADAVADRAYAEPVEALRERVESLQTAVASAEAPVKPRELEATRKGLSERLDHVTRLLDETADDDDLNALEARHFALARRVEELSRLDKPTADVAVLDAIHAIKQTLASHAEDISALKDG